MMVLHGAGKSSTTNISSQSAGRISLNHVKDPHERNRILRWQIFAAVGSLDAIVGRSGVLTVSRSTALSAMRPIPRRGLSRDEAAMYIGVSPRKFDELVHDGRMPGPKRIDRRLIWDRYAIDLAFDALESYSPEPSNTWDDV
jgi:hypothetical protein